MDKPEDLLYLKQFVKQHPDNKMGWYLLGKHYLETGKEGKANYCFIQAGDIYEAFEQEAHPLAERELEQLKEWGRLQKKKRLTRKVVIALIPLLLAALLLPLSDLKKKGAESPASTSSGLEQPQLGVVIVPQQIGQPIGYAMDTIIKAGGDAPDSSIAVRLQEKDGWVQWNGRMRPLLSVQREKSGSDEMDVSMHDRETCLCVPGDGSAVKNAYQKWKSSQEMHWTLASGIHHFRRLYGKWPASLEELIRPYPQNILAGEGEGMKESFPYVLAKLKQVDEAGKTEGSGGQSPGTTKASPGHNGKKQSASRSPIGTNGLFQAEWSKPLEIVVDVSSHQLAVVQGDMVIRSYRVGLGGDRTPEGSFYISEKVRNPNGTEDGIFGSRGMTLSDTLYAIHGTDDPDSIGKDESLGCIRMRKADVEELYDMVPLGTKVTIKNGTFPSELKPSAERFRLEPKENETNPVKVYRWLT